MKRFYLEISSKKDLIQIGLAFIAWRVILFFIAFLGPTFIPQFGNRFPYVKEMLISTNLPSWIWSFGNFDGVHYLTIASSGYSAQFTQAFFPFFPLTVWIIHFLISSFFVSALLISNLSFLVTLCLLYKLFLIDFSKKVSIRSILLLLAFPTAYYFGAIYSESMFLLFVVSCLLLSRKKKFFWAAIFAALASATKVFGVVLFGVILIEILNEILIRKKFQVNQKVVKNLGVSLLSPLGLIGYMIYLKSSFGNPLYFLSSQPYFGASRSSTQIILLPQVVVRYLKIFLTVPFFSLPFFNAFLEFVFTFIPLIFLSFIIRKVRLSYTAFIVFCFILPTLTGTLSSMPRYSLMGFLLLPFLADQKNKIFYSIFFSFLVLQVILLIMFTRGYWVA